MSKAYVYLGDRYEDTDYGRFCLARDIVCGYSSDYDEEFRSWVDFRYTATELIDFGHEKCRDRFEEMVDRLWDDFADEYARSFGDDVLTTHKDSYTEVEE